MPEDLAGEGKACLEESGEEAEQRKSANTGGEHRPGPVGGCPGCINICRMSLTEYERACYQEAWDAWHRVSMMDAVPLEVVIWHWSKKQRDANRRVLNFKLSEIMPGQDEKFALKNLSAKIVSRLAHSFITVDYDHSPEGVVGIVRHMETKMLSKKDMALTIVVDFLETPKAKSALECLKRDLVEFGVEGKILARDAKGRITDIQVHAVSIIPKFPRKDV